MNIFIGNLNFTVEEDELKGLFEEYGEVDSAKIITDKYSGRSKGFGFVEMSDTEKAKQAVEALNGTSLKGRDINVNEARERSNDERKTYNK